MSEEDVQRRFIGKLSPPRLGFWLASAVPAFLLLITLGVIDIVPTFQVWRHPGATSGIVKALECGERQRMTYRYQVASRVYTRRGRFSDAGIRCVEASVGMSIPVTYNRENPRVSLATPDPARALKRRIGALAISMAVAYVGTMLAVWAGVRFGPLLPWGR